MREILFKAKRLDNGGWVEGYPLKGERSYIVTENKASIYQMGQGKSQKKNHLNRKKV